MPEGEIGLLTLKIGRHSGNDIVLEQKDISKFHANLTVCSPTSFIVEDIQSKNGTYYNGMRIVRKLVDINDEILLASNKYLVCDLIPKQVLDKPIIKSDPLDFTMEFANLKELEISLVELKMSAQDKQKQLRLKSLLAASVIGVGTVITTGGIGAIAVAHTTLQVLSSLGLGMLLPTILSDKVTQKEKIDLLEKEFRDNYRCPKCKDSFGKKIWEDLAKQKICKKCNAVWVK